MASEVGLRDSWRDGFDRRLLGMVIDDQVRKRPSGRIVQSLPEASCPIIDDI